MVVGGRGQDALHDPGGDAGECVSAVLFEIELALEGVVDRFDALPYGAQQATTGACRLGAVRGRTTVIRMSLSQVPVLRSEVALVYDQNQSTGW